MSAETVNKTSLGITLEELQNKYDFLPEELINMDGPINMVQYNELQIMRVDLGYTTSLNDSMRDNLMEDVAAAVYRIIDSRADLSPTEVLRERFTETLIASAIMDQFAGQRKSGSQEYIDSYLEERKMRRKLNG